MAVIWRWPSLSTLVRPVKPSSSSVLSVGLEPWRMISSCRSTSRSRTMALRSTSCSCVDKVSSLLSRRRSGFGMGIWTTLLPTLNADPAHLFPHRPENSSASIEIARRAGTAADVAAFGLVHVETAQWEQPHGQDRQGLEGEGARPDQGHQHRDDGDAGQ